MDQAERLDDLLEKLKEDSIQYKNMEVANDVAEKRRMIRSLMNIRMPRTIAPELLEIQDDFLQEEAVEKGIVTLDDIPTIGERDIVYKETIQEKAELADKISIWQGDITRLKVGAIVNAANTAFSLLVV